MTTYTPFINYSSPIEDDNYINNMPPLYKRARVTMEMVGLLHERGYGKLKIYCDFSPSWKAIIFASDGLPVSNYGITNIVTVIAACHFMLPLDHIHAADYLENNYSMDYARGSDEVYVDWFRNALKLSRPYGILEMTNNREVIIHNGNILTLAPPVY